MIYSFLVDMFQLCASPDLIRVFTLNSKSFIIIVVKVEFPFKIYLRNPFLCMRKFYFRNKSELHWSIILVTENLYAEILQKDKKITR